MRTFVSISGPCLSFLTLIKSEDTQVLKESPLCPPLQMSTKPHTHRPALWSHLPALPVWLFHRLLESQLQAQKRSHENEAEALRGEIQSLKEENNRQQQLLAQNLQLPPEARIEASLQHEITRLTNENLVSRGSLAQSLLSRRGGLSFLLIKHIFPGWENSAPHLLPSYSSREE